MNSILNTLMSYRRENALLAGLLQPCNDVEMSRVLLT
jgi:hypothetical protein